MREELRFGWVVPDTLAGSARPGAGGNLEGDLADFRSLGIRAVVTAAAPGLPSEALRAAGLAGLTLPVEDGRAPTPGQMDRFISFVEANRPVLVHCDHGVGRTATFIAAYVICAKRRTAKQAISYVAANRFGRGRPGPSTETRVQDAALEKYAERCRERERLEDREA